jgi:prepilin-type N-terminal cleavage/methylation domain-containing protein
MRRPRGYSLLEVLVALTILAFSLAVLLGSQATSARMMERANRMALASMLIRSKMIDIEGELAAEGFQETDQRFRGDFRREGFPDMEWQAVVQVLEIPSEAAPQFAAAINSQLFGDGENQGSLSGSGAVSQWMPMIMAEIPNFINEMCRNARRIELEVRWEEGRHEQTLTVEQYVTNLDHRNRPASGMIPTVPGAGPMAPMPIDGGGMIPPGGFR